jgi:hypothetical protein
MAFRELFELVNDMKLTYNPLDDMYKIMKLGDMIYKSKKYQQWKSCVDLYESMSSELDMYIPDFSYPREEMKQKIDTFREQNVCPRNTKNDLLEYFRTIYSVQTGFNPVSHDGIIVDYSTEDIKKGEKYFEFMNSLRYVLDKVYTKYIYQWDEIDAKFDTLNYLIEEKFGHLELQEEYVDFTNKIMGLMDEVDELVKPFYKYNEEYIDKGYLERDYKMCFNIVMTKNEVDSSTEELLRSTIYATNLQLNRVSLRVKIIQEKLSNLIG